jgi:uncharacterized membrane protein (DUF4010 family)
VRKDQPHPFVAFLGLLIVVSLIVGTLKTRLLPPVVAIPLAIGFVALFRWVSRWSGRVARERRERELERLRRTPVLGLHE